jgi:phosphoribosylaminoimidazole-succinocarboxamide synthase
MAIPFGPKLAEGKTKIVYADPAGTTTAYLYHKDDITAGDGTRHHVIPGKGALAGRTTANVFMALNQAGIPTHFIAAPAPNVSLVRLCRMIPLEVVIRRRAFGSYLKRHPEATEGQTFEPPIVEFFLKDDALHDPLITLHEILERGIASEPEVRQMEDLARRAFLVIEACWARLGVEMVDLKVEFGRDSDGRLLLADVIDNDSWRIWPRGNKDQMLDKQVYRDLRQVTPEALEAIKALYSRVADLTDSFQTGGAA